MGEVERFLKNHTGFCIFPVKDPTTGKFSRLCNAMTFEENGRKMPFCRDHMQQVHDIQRQMRNRKDKKPHMLLGAVGNSAR